MRKLEIDWTELDAAPKPERERSGYEM